MGGGKGGDSPLQGRRDILVGVPAGKRNSTQKCVTGENFMKQLLAV